MTAGVIATQWTTPTTPGQRPFIMWADWTDIWQYIDIFSIDISSTAGNAPRILTFTAMNLPSSVVLSKQMRILFWDSQAASNAGRPLFHGFIKHLKPTLTAIRADWVVTCADLSELMDYGTPIESMIRPAGESDAARIGAAMAFSSWSGALGGGYVQMLRGSMPGSDWSHGSVRSGVEDTLAKTGVSPIGYYQDDYGYLHTYQSSDAGAAPWQISDTPNYTTTLPAKLEPDFPGEMDVDAVFVEGGTAAGTGYYFGSNAPRFPARTVVLNAPDSVDAIGLAYAGAVELGARQGVTNAQVSVSGDAQHGNFDGWLVGQSLAITNSVLGWVAKGFYINGVDMTFVNGAGMRRYVLSVSTMPRAHQSFVQMVGAPILAKQTTPVSAKLVRGYKGPAKGTG